jgi:uncharacterized protein (TIGR02246 family)
MRNAFPVFLLLLVSPAIQGAATGLSPKDTAKIRQVHKKYEEAWLKGDANAVRSLFTEDCVLLPPHAGTPRVGQKGLNEFWFPPDAPSTQITKLIVTPENIGGDGQIAFAWGTDEVAWTTVQNGQTTYSSHKGIFLNILKKQPDGEWKFSHHMWDDAIPRH